MLQAGRRERAFGSSSSSSLVRLFLGQCDRASTIGVSAPPVKGPLSSPTVKRLLRDGWIVTMDASDAEFASGWVLLEDGVVASCGDGPPPDADEVVRLGGAVVTPGLVNTHHHFYQTLTRA